MFKKKLQDDGNDIDISKYRKNLGLSDAIIDEVKKDTIITLDSVLTIDERKKFILNETLEKINKIIDNMIKADRLLMKKVKKGKK